jgi:hypothetical protein
MKAVRCAGAGSYDLGVMEEVIAQAYSAFDADRCSGWPLSAAGHSPTRAAIA